MAILKKTASDFASDLEDAILDRNANYDTKIGPIPDLVINPTANVLELQNERIRSVQQLLALVNDGSFTDADLDAFVYNELIVRMEGGKASVNLIFSRLSVPTTDLTVRANFPVSTLQDEESGSVITFITSAEATMYAAQAYSYFNPVTQRFELSVPAVSLTGSSSANVAPGRITKPLRSLVGFDSVTNREGASGGTDVELNGDLIRRYYLSLRGSSPAVTTGILKILKDKYPSVTDALIVHGSNPLNIRAASDAGAVDVYVIGSVNSVATENVIFNGVGQVMPLSNQPVSSITSIGSYIQGTDYELSKTTGGNADSVRAEDGPIWLVGAASTPTLYATLTVSYVYNSLLTLLQSGFTQDDSYVIGRDLLFKEADQVDIDISGQIKIRPGYNVSATLSAVNNTILTMINAMQLGDDVELSDLQAAVRSYAAIDNFVVTNMSRVGDSGTTDVAIADNEYARLDASNLLITVV